MLLKKGTLLNTIQGWLKCIGKSFNQLNHFAEMNLISQQYLKKGGHSSEACLIFPSDCLVVRLSYNLTSDLE